MSPLTFHRTMVLLHRLPGPLSWLAVQLFLLFCRTWYCSRGQHVRVTGNYCEHGCGKLLVAHAWREWSAALRDGSTVRVVAVGEAHARNLIVYGIDGHDAVVMHPDNIVSCQAGQIAEEPDYVRQR